MKGIGTTIGSIILILILVVFAVIFIVTAFNENQKRLELNLETAELLNAKETFSSLHRSLGMTWFVSSVQAVFRAYDESVGCGFDDSRIDEAYWYRYDPSRDKTEEESLIPLPTDKYNIQPGEQISPVICFPQDQHIEEYIESTFRSMGLLDIEKSFSVNNARAEIGSVDLKDVSVGPGRIETTAEQRIRVSTSNTDIDAATENANTIFAELSSAAAGGRNIVDYAVQLSDLFRVSGEGDEFNPSLRYQTSDTRDSYLERIRPLLGPEFLGAGQQPSVDVFPNEVLLDVEGIRTTNSLFRRGDGLWLHYDYMISLEQLSSESAAIYQWPTDSRAITSCYGYRADPITGDYEFHNGVDFAGSGTVRAIADGTVTTVFAGCVKGDLSCGAGYGNQVKIAHKDGRSSLYTHLETVSVSEGQEVEADDPLGIMGETGRTTGVNMHLEITEGGMNPCSFIDCRQSQQKKCEPGDYYYNGQFSDQGETKEAFSKRPFVLNVRVEDYLPALDCNAERNSIDRNNPIPYYTYQSQKDLVCCRGDLWTCNIDSEKFPDEFRRFSGQTIGGSCADLLEAQNIARDLECTGSGFRPIGQPA